MRSVHDFPSLNSKDADGVKPDGTPYKIIVIEDQDFQRKQIIQILESEEYKVIGEASNGAEGLSLIERLGDQIDLITSDLDMPVMDGYAMLYELNQKPKRPKIIFISDETTKGVLQDLLQMGIAGFILKPIQRNRILERVKQILKGLPAK